MENENKNFNITPETKIGALLDHYPQLEETLIEMAPAFKKLKNPILRKAVAKVATLRQVAQIGDVSLPEMINKLRSQVGQDNLIGINDEQNESATAPSWFDSSRITKTLDARPIIESEQQPMNQVLEELKEIKPGDIYELITPFVPAPLIDMVKKKEFRVWSFEQESELIKTYFVHS